MAVALRRHDELLRSAIEGVGGYVFKTVGDAFCAAFASAKGAVQAATLAQKALLAEQWPPEAMLRVRMALHTGECEERDGDYFGQALNRVARLQAIAHGGQVILSRATADVVRDHLGSDIGLRDLGTHRLKDLGRPEEVYQLEVDGLDADFRPLRSLENSCLPNNLPEMVSSFVGRDAEVAAVRRLVDGSRLVTLTGPGGVGKTRLALQVAAEQLHGTCDGVWLVELATVSSPGAIPGAVAMSLGIKDQSARPMLDALVVALADQNILLVLDNCEHLIEPCAKLAEVMLRGCPRVQLISTSREPLGIAGEQIFRVPSLSLPPEDTAEPSELAASDAVTLFVERARSQGVGFALTDDAVLVGAICRRLDGVPLAIELATGRLRSMSLVDLNKRLDERFRLLTGGSRTALPRQQTLRAMVDWSYDLLNGFEQAVLRRASVFVGGFELEAAESVCGFGEVEGVNVADLVGSLVDKSLVMADTSTTPVRYQLLETIRQYAAEKLVEVSVGDEAERARSAHAQLFLSFAEDGAPHLVATEQVDWMDRFDAEHDNLRAAAVYLLGDAALGVEKALRLGASLRWFWVTRGCLGEGVDFLETALDRSLHIEVNSFHRAAALAAVAELHFGRGAFDTARARSEEGLQIANRADSAALISDFTCGLAWIAHNRGDYSAARLLAEEALASAQRCGDPYLVGVAFDCRAGVSESSVERSRADFSQALMYFRLAGNRQRIAISLLNLAVTELGEREVSKARAHLDTASGIAKVLKDETMVLGILYMSGLADVIDKDHISATRSFTQALRTARRFNYPYSIDVECLLGLALSATIAGDVERACTLHGAADAIFDRLGVVLDPIDRELREADDGLLRGIMGESAFQHACQAGRNLSRADAIAFALKGTDAS